MEITEVVSRVRGRAYDQTQIRLSVKQLIGAGRVSGRKETDAERLVRSGGRMPSGNVRSRAAELFWAPAGTVPTRTVTEAVPGVTLYDSSSTPARKIYKKYKTKRDARKRNDVELVDVSQPFTTPSQNEIVDMLIEKIVAERTADLAQQLAAKEAELQKLKDFLKSAL
jgi:hypothetical protein